MSTSGLCSCSSRTHEVGPVPVFVSEENPGGVVFFSLQKRREAGSFVCTAVRFYGRGRLPPPSRTACLDGYELLTALIPTENLCLIPGMAVTCLCVHAGPGGDFDRKQAFVGHHCVLGKVGGCMGWEEGVEGEISRSLPSR